MAMFKTKSPEEQAAKEAERGDEQAAQEAERATEQAAKQTKREAQQAAREREAFRRSPVGRAAAVWVKARPDAIEPLTPHEARHCCASYLAAAGLTPKEAQTATGHADIRTTLNTYAKA